MTTGIVVAVVIIVVGIVRVAFAVIASTITSVYITWDAVWERNKGYPLVLFTRDIASWRHGCTLFDRCLLLLLLFKLLLFKRWPRGRRIG